MKNRGKRKPLDGYVKRGKKLISPLNALQNTSQLQEWAIDVNVGSWSGKSTRDMALEADCESLYKFAYMPFRGAAHSMWQHVGIYNVERCERALHKGHRIPQILGFSPDLDYLYRSSKYVSRTYSALSAELGLEVKTPLPVEFFLQESAKKRVPKMTANNSFKPNPLRGSLNSGNGLMIILAMLLVISGAAQASDTSALPPEVQSYIEGRDLCEHFRQEPFEGNSPEQIERRKFLQESVEIHCAGTDRRLAALKERYVGNRAVLSRLESYEIASEEPCH